MSARPAVHWNMSGHQLVTPVVPGPVRPAGDSEVDGHEVPVPHFGRLMETEHFHELAERLHAAGTAFLVDPYLRFPGPPAEQWTMFCRDPAGNAPEFTAFSDETRVFAR